MIRAWCWVACALLAALWVDDALAYRPFDGTDAAAAEPGPFEVELGPVRFQQIGPGGALFAPDVVFNHGLAERWELVLPGSLQAEASGVALTDNGLFLKGMLCRRSIGAPAECRHRVQRHRRRPQLWTLRPVAEFPCARCEPA